MGGLFGGKKPKAPEAPKIRPVEDTSKKIRQEEATAKRDNAAALQESRRRRANLASNILFGGSKDANGKSDTLG